MRGKPAPNERFVVQGTPVLIELLDHDDDEVKVDALWGISYATEWVRASR